MVRTPVRAAGGLSGRRLPGRLKLPGVLCRELSVWEGLKEDTPISFQQCFWRYTLFRQKEAESKITILRESLFWHIPFSV